MLHCSAPGAVPHLLAFPTDPGEENAILVGRGARAPPGQAFVCLQLPGQGLISRRHARLVRTTRGCVLEDLHSLNGTSVNGVRIEGQHELQDGDQVVFGSAAFHYVFHTVPNSQGQIREETDSEVDLLPVLGTNRKRQWGAQGAVAKRQCLVGCTCHNQDSLPAPAMQRQSGVLGDGDQTPVLCPSSPLTVPVPIPQLPSLEAADAALAVARILPPSSPLGHSPSTSQSTPSPTTGSPGRDAVCTSAWALALGEEFKCCICQELMVEAHALPCSHCFCRLCIAEWVSKATTVGKQPTCPNCRTAIQLPPTPVKVVDNAIEKIAELFLSADERRDRLARLEAAHTALPPLWAASGEPADSLPRVEGSAVDSSDDSPAESEDVTVGVEYSKSGRAMCRTCGVAIPNRALRWYVENTSLETLGYPKRFHHFACLHPLREFGVAYEDVEGLYSITALDRARVRALLGGGEGES